LEIIGDANSDPVATQSTLMLNWDNVRFLGRIISYRHEGGFGDD
jgi:hypothetical protein